MAWQRVKDTYVASDAITHVRVTTTSTSQNVEVWVRDHKVESFGPYPIGDPRVEERLAAIIRGDSPVTN